MIYHLEIPIADEEIISTLQVGDIVYLNGSLYTMRDKAHNRLFKAADSGEEHLDLLGAAVWHCGPVIKEEQRGYLLTSAGSTTSYRFSDVTPRLLKDFGVKLLVGKGGLSDAAIEALRGNGVAFLSTVGGCAGLYGKYVKEIQNVFYTELGLPEAIWQFRVENFGALIVTIDSSGRSLYQETKLETSRKVPELVRELNVSDSLEYIYWPPKLPGGSAASDYFKNCAN